MFIQDSDSFSEYECHWVESPQKNPIDVVVIFVGVLWSCTLFPSHGERWLSRPQSRWRNQRSFAASIFSPCVEHGRFVVGLHVDRPHRVRPIGSDWFYHFDSPMALLVHSLPWPHLHFCFFHVIISYFLSFSSVPFPSLFLVLFFSFSFPPNYHCFSFLLPCYF